MDKIVLWHSIYIGGSDHASRLDKQAQIWGISSSKVIEDMSLAPGSFTRVRRSVIRTH